MDLQEQPTRTGPGRNGSTSPLTATDMACLRAAVAHRGLEAMPGGYFIGHRLSVTGDTGHLWPADIVWRLLQAGLLECSTTPAPWLPTDAAYRLLDGAA